MFIEAVVPSTPKTPIHAIETAAKKSWRRQRRVARFAARYTH